jgi:hypothetical protein
MEAVMMQLQSLRFAAWLAPLAVGLLACDATAPGTRPLSLSVTSRSAGPAAGPSSNIVVGSGAAGITITAAQMTLGEIELSPSGSCGAETNDADAAGTANDNHEDSCEELDAGPVTVDLPVDGTTKAMLHVSVPAGTYEGLQAELVSVQVSFTDASGAKQTFTSKTEAKLEMRFPAALTVAAGGTLNLTVDVDVSSWFKDANGTVLDPTNPANADAINANIRKSFHAFDDENQDGVDDHEEGTGGH